MNNARAFRMVPPSCPGLEREDLVPIGYGFGVVVFDERMGTADQQRVQLVRGESQHTFGRVERFLQVSGRQTELRHGQKGFAIGWIEREGIGVGVVSAAGGAGRGFDASAQHVIGENVISLRDRRDDGSPGLGKILVFERLLSECSVLGGLLVAVGTSRG